MSKHIDEAALADELDAVEMGELISRLDATGKWWMIGKGRVRKSEPMFGCLIQEAFEDGPLIAKAEGDDLAKCIEDAISKLPQ